MESTLKDLVRENGFAAVFESLRTLVEAEYNRSKADYDFLSSLLKKSEPVVETKEIVIETAAVADEEDAKLVNIISSKAPAAMKKRVIRK
jgi:hypothetical protein